MNAFVLPFARALPRAVCAVLFLASAPLRAQNLVQNGGFESGQFAPWILSGNDHTCYVTNLPAYVHSGQEGAQLGPDTNPAFLTQTLATTPGVSYSISLWVGHDTVELPNDFQILWNNTLLLDATNLGNIGWTNLQVTAQASSNSSLLTLRFIDNPDYLGLDDVSVTPATVTPVVTWANPAPIYSGAPLSSNELDATANVPGTFAYTPILGTILPVGTNELTVVFTPNATNEPPLTNSVSLIVLPRPSDEDLYGHFLFISTNSSLYTNFYLFTNELVICNPTLDDSRPGFVELDEYFNGGGQLSLGQFPFPSVPAGGCVTVDVGGEAQNIGDGDGFTTNIYGTVYEQPAQSTNQPQGQDSQLIFQFFSPAPPNGGVPTGGSGLSAPGFSAPPELTNLTITGPITVQTNSTNHYLATAGFGDGSTETNVAATWSSSLFTISNGVFIAGAVTTNTVVVISNRLTVRSVTKAASFEVTVLAPRIVIQPVVTWTNPPAIYAGAPLSSNELDATANVPGTFAYNPPAGAILPVGTNQLSVVFTPADTTQSPLTNFVTLLVFPPPSEEDLYGHFLSISTNILLYNNLNVFTNELTLCNPTLDPSRPGYVEVDEFLNGGGQFTLGQFPFASIPGGACMTLDVGGEASNIGGGAGFGTNIYALVYEQSPLPGNPPQSQDSQLIFQFFNSAPPNGGPPTGGGNLSAPGFNPPPELTNLTVTGPALVRPDAPALFLATAAFGDGTTQTNLAFTWSSSLFSISNGLFFPSTVATDTPVAINAGITIRTVAKTAARAATVVAPHAPQLSIASSSLTPFTLQLIGTTGQAYSLQAAANLDPNTSWIPLATNQILSNSQTLFTDPGAPTNAQRFYRAKTLP